MKRTKIASVAVVVALGIACIASVTGERMNTNEYGRMVAVNALYDEPETQPRYEKVSYEDMENLRFESDQKAKVEFDNSRADENLTTAVDPEIQNNKNKAALRAIANTDQSNRKELAEERQEQYQLNKIKEVDTSTKATVDLNQQQGQTVVLPQGNAAIAVPIEGTPEMGRYEGQFVLTAYCPCAICCGKTNGITACGTLATANHTIATDGRYAFGTKMLINGVIYTVEDRGGAIQGNRIDVFFPTHEEALQFGRQTADVYIID